MIDYEVIVDESFRKYQPLQTKAELIEAMKVLEAEKPKRIVELGVFRGGTLYPWSMCASDDARVVGIDTPGTPLSVESDMLMWLKPQQVGKLILGNTHSEVAVKETMDFLGGPIDFIFIDAEHRYETVKADFDTWVARVRPGGLIGFHDLSDNDGDIGVRRFYDEICGAYRHQEICVPKGHGIGFLWVSE